MVKLSVIVPFYNVQTYAPDTLRSLRANAREDFEFILVDDCSTDGTADILRRAEDVRKDCGLTAQLDHNSWLTACLRLAKRAMNQTD